MRKLCIAAFAVLSAASFTAGAGDPPTIGGNANISVSVGKAGIVNAGGAGGAGNATVKQSVASMLSGVVGGNLKMNVTIGDAGVINVGGAGGGGTMNACQAVGTIGTNC